MSVFFFFLPPTSSLVLTLLETLATSSGGNPMAVTGNVSSGSGNQRFKQGQELHRCASTHYCRQLFWCGIASVAVVKRLRLLFHRRLMEQGHFGGQSDFSRGQGPCGPAPRTAPRTAQIRAESDSALICRENLALVCISRSNQTALISNLFTKSSVQCC